MTVVLIETKQDRIGLSSDTKPTLTLQDAGSTFYELNTGEAFIWSGTEWVEDIRLIYVFTQALAE